VSNKAIVQFDEFKLPLSTIRQLPKDHVAALAIFGYAVSELNTMARLFLSQSHQETGQRVIDEIIKAQKLVVLRAWSSKLFEVREFLLSICGKKSQTSDVELKLLATKAIDALDKLSSTDGYKAANDIRHEAAHHYSFEAAKKNLAHLPDDALCDVIIHQNRGNDFFPLGEYLMFHGRLRRRWKTVHNLARMQVEFEVWLKWCMEAKSSIEDSHAMFVNALLFNKLGRNAFQKKTYWVPETLVGHPFDHLTPVVLTLDRDT
jgi:hypothetical protein